MDVQTNSLGLQLLDGTMRTMAKTGKTSMSTCTGKVRHRKNATGVPPLSNIMVFETQTILRRTRPLSRRQTKKITMTIIDIKSAIRHGMPG
jgi:hypothetical protein